jgi:ribose transport system permease protein
LNWFYKSFATQITMFGTLVVLCVVMSIVSPYFLSASNFLNIGVAIAVSGTMAAGLTVVMIMGGIDLSQYAQMALIGMTTGLLLKSGCNPLIAIALAVLSGAMLGFVNAFIITKMRIVPMIATIATQLMCRAGAYLSTNGSYVRVTDRLFETIGYGSILRIPYLIIIMLAVFFFISYFLRNTAFGRQTYAIGGNAVASELSGINVHGMQFLGYVISGAVSGLAAVLLVSQVGSSMPNAGIGNEMDGIAAVFLGGVAFTGGKGYVSGTLIGVLLLAVLANGMTLLSVSPYFQQLTKGLVLLLSVYSDIIRGKNTN